MSTEHRDPEFVEQILGGEDLPPPPPPIRNGHDKHAAWIIRGREAGWLAEGAEELFLSATLRATLDAKDAAAKAWLREGREARWVLRTKAGKLYVNPDGNTPNPRPISDLDDDETPIVCETLEPIPITSIAPRTWAYGNFLLFGHAAVLGAVDGGGKGAHAVAIALSMITGRELLGDKVWRTGPVVIITYEDDQMEWRRRIAAACLHHDIDYDAVISSFYFITRPRSQITFAARLTSPGEVSRIGFPHSEAIIQHLKAVKPALFIVDPFNRAHALEDGNSNVMIALVAGEISRIAAEAGCAALVLHHLRKGSNG